MSVEADRLMQEAALRRWCWKCDAKAGQGCTSDIGDHGIMPCHPHHDRVIDGARDVIVALLAQLDALALESGATVGTEFVDTEEVVRRLGGPVKP